jgi:hypothetical protein
MRSRRSGGKQTVLVPRAACHFCISISILMQACGIENSAARAAINMEAVSNVSAILFTMRAILLLHPVMQPDSDA